MTNDEKRIFQECFIQKNDILFNKIFANKLPKKLLKFYCGLYDEYGNNHNIDSINEGYIWMSSPKKFNDPFDCALNFDNNILLIEYIKENNVYIGDADKQKYINSLNDSDSKLREESFVACFSEYKNVFSSQMWAKYANNHKGFCVEYNFYKIMKTAIERNTYNIFPVFYCDKPDIPLFIENNNNFIYAFPAFFRKSLEWKSEKEWRIYKASDKYIGCNGYKLDFISPDKIYAGCKSSYKLKEDLKKLCNDKRIEYYEIEIKCNSYKLGIKR